MRRVEAPPASHPANPPRAEWLLPAGVAAYLVICTWSQRVPIPGNPVFGLMLAVLTATALGVSVQRGLRPSPRLLLVILVCAACLLTDVIYVEHIRFTDLGIYLLAGHHLIHGDPVYAGQALIVMPRDATALPFLYPPPTLLLFAGLVAFPLHLGGILFVAASMAAVLLAARRLGVVAPWSLAVLAWPPVLDGLVSGNVSVPLFAVFVLAPWVGSGLVVAPLFKPYNAVAALWLFREHRFRAVLVGCAVVAGLCIVTLPLVGGPGAWLDWIGGLRAFAESEANIPALYGAALGRYAPVEIALVAGVAVTIGALRARGVEGLLRLGVATIVLQSSVYSHGFIVSLPALLSLRTAWFWVATAALSITISTGPSLGPDIGWPGTWIPIVLVLASWAVPSLRRDRSTLDDPYHPLGRVSMPWPGAETIAGPTTQFDA